MVLPHKSNSARASHRRTSLSIALLCAGLLGAAPAYTATITVDSNLDTSGNPVICTLRDAITAANTNVGVGGCVSGEAGQDDIYFNISGAGVHTIVLSSALPPINEPVTINGYTQPGALANSIAFAYPAGAAIDAQIMIEIDGGGSLVVGTGLFHVNQAASGTLLTGLSVGNSGDISAFYLAGQAYIYGNFIGVHTDGTTAWPNNDDIQVTATAQASYIGSVRGAPAQRNLMGGSVIIDAANVTVSGNLIGTNKSGTSVVGTSVLGGTLMLGPASGQTIVSDNVIGYGNTNVFGFGMVIHSSSNNQIYNNLIGIGVNGAPLTNGIGIYVANDSGVVSNNVISSNTIANSVVAGIQLSDNGPGGLSGNRLDFNSIYGNGGLGINLQANTEAQNTVTPNDPGDMDAGPNGLQNYPVITSAQVNVNGGIDIAFTLNSTPNGLINITAYANPTCHASGHGEGRYDSGSLLAVGTDASGNGASIFTVPAPLPTGWGVGQIVALLARDNATNNTSEFSACATVAPAGAVNQPPVAANDNYATPFKTTLTLT